MSLKSCLLSAPLLFAVGCQSNFIRSIPDDLDIPVLGFTSLDPGPSCREDLPKGTWYATYNGYDFRVHGFIPISAEVEYERVLHSISGAALACPIFFTAISTGQYPAPVTLWETQRIEDVDFRKEIEGIMGADTRLCHALFWGTMPQGDLALDTVQDCAFIVNSRLFKTGVTFVHDGPEGKKVSWIGVVLPGGLYWDKPE